MKRQHWKWKTILLICMWFQSIKGKSVFICLKKTWRFVFFWNRLKYHVTHIYWGLKSIIHSPKHSDINENYILSRPKTPNHGKGKKNNHSQHDELKDIYKPKITKLQFNKMSRQKIRRFIVSNVEKKWALKSENDIINLVWVFSGCVWVVFPIFSILGRIWFVVMFFVVFVFSVDLFINKFKGIFFCSLAEKNAPNQFTLNFFGESINWWREKKTEEIFIRKKIIFFIRWKYCYRSRYKFGRFVQLLS